MSLNRRLRQLVVGEQKYLWRVRHRHPPGCVEVLSVRRVGSSSGRSLHFGSEPGFTVPAGGVDQAGAVGASGGRWLNLNEPGVVRAFVDALTVADWPLDDRRFIHVIGWTWFDDAYQRRTSAVATRS